jgi:hypothetical protein
MSNPWSFDHEVFMQHNPSATPVHGVVGRTDYCGGRFDVIHRCSRNITLPIDIVVLQYNKSENPWGGGCHPATRVQKHRKLALQSIRPQ